MFRYQYDSWGNILSQSDALAEENPYRYVGYQYDQEAALYYLITRYYHPTHGVFLSLNRDSGDVDDILMQNGYAYANKQPNDSSDGGSVHAVGLYFVRMSKRFVRENPFPSSSEEMGKSESHKKDSLLVRWQKTNRG
ncbi:RHS repeat-associated protein [Saccharococcus thermophilus]|uniref:RHS repeat-associated protein n=1 Tax=Saccharococcus thermophilus TaxID=29396 RepID=A0A846MBN8_9BACL|nr:RHS repeat-associated protein [Saccharococcus thermophilus]